MPWRRSGFIYSLLYGPSAKLRTYEWAVIEAVLRAAPESLSAKLKNHLSECKRRQRHSADRVLAFFPDHPGQRSLTPLLNEADEFIIAKVQLQTVGQSPLKGTLYAASGSLFSVEFDSTPSEHGIRDGTELTATVTWINPEADTPR